jgi:alpha-glucosidase (family GH31 glycosyl hydrolase)
MILLILITILSFTNSASFVEPPYPVWAHSHWVWLNGKMQNQTNLLEMVAKYQEYNITVGALNIDSAWTTGYNNFKWNYTKF